MNEEEWSISDLENLVARDKAVYDAAREEAGVRGLALAASKNRLAQAHASKAGIKVGSIIEFEYGQGKSRARVEEIRKPRATYYGNVFDLHVRAILRDGSEDKRISIVESSHFLPQNGFGSVNGQRPPRARIITE